jgi:hypothetical protein
MMRRTDDHYGELKSLSHTLTVYLVGEIGEADVSHELLADDWGDTGKVARNRGT